MPEVPAFETTALQREHARHARDGALTLQTCGDCGTVQYPTRDVCRRCLSGTLHWSEQPTSGRVVATGVVHASLDPGFKQQAPWRICSVLLDAGPVVLAHVPDAPVTAGDAVNVRDRIVGEERSILVAARISEGRKAEGK